MGEGRQRVVCTPDRLRLGRFDTSFDPDQNRSALTRGSEEGTTAKLRKKKRFKKKE